MSKDRLGRTPPAPPWVYQQLRRSFGSQGWWPVTPEENSDAMKPQYHPDKQIKLTATQAFEIALGAILTQNTAWPNVEKAIMALQQSRLMHPKKIAATSDGRLEALIRPSGYFTQKTKKLKIFASFVINMAQGNLLSLQKQTLPSLRRSLLALWGVGPETADSILLYALNKPVFVVDAYTRRIGTRLGWPFAKKNYDDIRLFFEQTLEHSTSLFQEYHALLVQLAKKNCLKNTPLCANCPLMRRCCWAQSKMQDAGCRMQDEK